MTSDSKLNNSLKNNSCPLFVPFDLYKDLIFLINFLLSTCSSKPSGNEFKNSFLNFVKKFEIVLSGSRKFSNSCMLFTGLGL